MTTMEIPRFPLTVRDRSDDEQCREEYYCVDCREMHDCDDCDACRENTRRDAEFDVEQTRRFYGELAEYFARTDIPCQRCGETTTVRKHDVQYTEVSLFRGLIPSTSSVPTSASFVCVDVNACYLRSMAKE